MRRIRRALLITGVLLTCMPVFSRADTGEREEPEARERPENELRIEASPATGYGRFTICDSLSRVRYGGLGASARYRHDMLAARLGGSVSAVHQHVRDEEGDEPPSRETRATIDGVAQVGLDTRYIALMGGVAAVTSRSNGDQDGGFLPSVALRLGDSQSLSLKLAIADTTPVALALLGGELAYQHKEQLRVGVGARVDAFTLNALPTARVELPVGGHWLGVTAGTAPSEGALAWQLQLMFDFQALAWGAK